MGFIGLYIAKSVLTLTFLYAFYWIFLRNETYYSWNRIYLLVSMVLSLIFPFFNVTLHDAVPAIYNSLIDSVSITVQNSPVRQSTFSHSISILSIIYISGAVFFSLRLLSSLSRIRFLFTRFPKVKYNGFKAVILDNDQSPFTFFNILFLSRIDFEGGKTDEMIVHEKAHREGLHSFDVILAELLTIIQWFNPVVWLFRRSLKAEHEFIADKKVLSEGYDSARYQKFLLEKSLGATSVFMANNFNYSLLKKRINMMTTKNSGPLVQIKYLVSVPVLLIAITLAVTNFKVYGQTDEVYTEVDEQAMYNNGDISGVAAFFMENIVYPESAINHNVSGKIFVQFVIDERGNVTDEKLIWREFKDGSGKEIAIETDRPVSTTDINLQAVSELENEVLRVVKLLKGFTPAKKDGKNVKSQYTIPVKFSFE